MKRTPILLIALISMVSCNLKSSLKSQSANRIPDGYELVWSDEFDGTQVDANNWKFENWRPGMVNHELQRYVAGGELDGHKTAKVENGHLVITAMACMRRNRYSGRSWLPC